jgi:tetratricopeptide (TPR) repeat protein
LAAAEQALQARALGDAEARFHQVLRLLEDPATVAAPARIAALCGLGEAQRDQGNPEYRSTLLEAGRLAHASTDVPLLVRAALANSRGLPSVMGAVDADRVAITQAALEAVGPQPTPDRARLLAQLANELCFAGDGQQHVALSDEAEDIARGLGDGGLLAWVLNRTGYAAFAPDRIERLVARGEEATQLSDVTGDPAQRVLSRYHWSGGLLAAGDLPAFRQVTEAMLAVSSDAAPTLQWFARITQARLALLDGRFEDARRINDDALSQAQDLGEPDGVLWWAGVSVSLEILRGSAAAVVDAVGDSAGQSPDLPAFSVVHAALLARLGRLQEAREVLARRPPDPDELISDVFPFWVSSLAWAPFYLDDARLAARVAATLRPYQGYWGHMYTFVVGPVTSHLALCAAATGDLDESVALFEESDQVMAGFGCHGLLPLFRLAYAEVLRRRGSDHDHRRAIQLLDQVRQGATAVGAPNLVGQADELAAVIISASR